MENLKNVAPIEDFNWDAYENGESVASASHEELEKAYDNTLNKVNDREVVDGTVIAMNKREVVVNIGYKSDGIIPMSEFRYNPELKVGDTVEVYIENQEDKKGQLVLSHRKARATRSWDRVNAALENEEIIKGYIKCRTKGGMIVDVFGIEAFLPGSQIDVKPIRDYDVFVGKTMEFKVVKINQEFKNVVVSHKALIEAELEQQKKEIIGKLEKGQVLEGTVKNITSYGVFIDLGGVDGLIHITDLSWGRVSDPKEVVELDQKLNVVILDFDDEKKRIALGLKQLTPHPWDALDANLKVGDVVEVYVENQEDKRGQLILSHKKARLSKSWERVNAALDNEEVIQGYIKCRTKGGMIVDVFGIEAFLPGSQIDVHPIRDYDVFVGKTMEFKVVKINQEFRNVVVSHKALIEAELEAQKKEIISKLEKGQILEGTVKNITSYGVFVDLGGVDGLIHITDLSWGRVSDPHEVVALDQKINVVILDFDDEKKRIALGLKQLTPHPWDALDADLKVGDRVKGKVVVIADYGAFVEIAPGVEGLIHVSEMSWSQHLRSAQEFLHVGDEVEAVILTLDRDERKMSLGIKQLKEDPWETIEVKYPVGSKHTAKVRNFTNFGIFVELEEGVDGLIHISDLSWTKKVKHPSEFTQVGAEIDVVVLEIDKENRRLSLGHKQLEDNPWDAYESIYTPGSVHNGKITEMMDKGAVITLDEGGEGFATPKHLVKEDGTQAQLGEELPFKVIEFVKDTKRIILSHSRTFEQAKEDTKPSRKHSAKKETAPAINNIAASTTLGDLDALAELKAKMEKGE